MKETLGCKLSQVDLRDYKLNKFCTLSESLPDSYSVEMTHKIKNQGAVCSCTSHALAAILEHHDHNINTLSTNFIYGLQRYVYGESGPGEKIRVALGIANKYGDPIKSLCDGNTEVDAVYGIAEHSVEDNDTLEDAYRHRIKSYIKLTSDRDIKFALMNYGPVIAGIKWYDKYKFIRATSFVEPDKSSQYGYHAIVIYGWNELGWLCQNSWGSFWGNCGLFKISYDYGISEAYGVIDDDELGSLYPEIVVPVHGKDWLEGILKFINKIINWVLGRK